MLRFIAAIFLFCATVASAGETFSAAITDDFIIAEVRGARVRVVATLTATKSGRVLERVYELAPFAQQKVVIAAALRSVGPVKAQFSVEGEGSVVVLRAATDGAAPLPAVASFKAAPFRERATGLVFMRDRWYDPSAGTFISPDPEGYADSSNPYVYCGGDPVNCADPTGRAGDGGDLRNDFRMKERAEAARRHAIWCARNPVECKKLEVRGRAIMRIVGGMGQTTAGAGAIVSTGPIPEPATKTFGGTAIVRGIDNMITGAVETWTGTPRDTLTGRALYLALVKSGVSPLRASKITGWSETGVDVASTLGSGLISTVNVPRPLPPIRSVPGLTGLRFGANDLVYGPSARGYLRALQQEAGGVLLDDLPKPPNLSWEEFTRRTLDEAAQNGRRVRFDLTHVEDLEGVLSGEGEWANTITGDELRYLQANWSRFAKITHFYVDGIEVAAPWVK